MNDFFANLFELWGAAIIENSQASFSNQMYDNGLYPSIGLLMCISAVLFVILYYFIINHARLSKWYWWGLFGLVVPSRKWSGLPQPERYWRQCPHGEHLH